METILYAVTPAGSFIELARGSRAVTGKLMAQYSDEKNMNEKRWKGARFVRYDASSGALVSSQL